MSVRRQLVAIGAVAALAAYGLVLAANHRIAPHFAPAAGGRRR